MGPFDVLAELTGRLASTTRLDDVVDLALHEIARLGFDAVWMAVIDEQTGNLATLKAMIDGVEATHVMPKLFIPDVRQPLGRGFRERRAINITDPGSLHIIERDDDPVPPGKLALPRASLDRTHGHPFACCPLLGSQGEPVGAVCVSSYHGGQPIPDAMLSHGVLRAIIDLLAIAMERALQAERIERLNACLVKAQAAIARDARVKTVGELAAAVAHDLNNLSGIALLAASVGSRSAADAVDTMPRIERAIRAIGDLVARLQRIARRPSGDGEAANLTQIVDDIVVMVKPLLREQSIEIEAELPAVPPVRCDPVLIHQVVLNLVINARDALVAVPSDRRRIKLRVHDDGGVVRLIVADTGPGIAAEVFAHLFEPFFTTKRAGHFGLGLASGQAALAQYGAQLDAHNASAGGAVFELTLMAAPSQLAPGAAPPRPGPIMRSRSARILAVDDDTDVVEFIVAYLEPFGYEVSTATTSARALELARSQDFDLVLCDVGMPKQSGIEVARELRAGGYRGKLVLMTGWDTPTLSSDARAADCDQLLKKPFVGTELVDVLDALLAP
jgi:signal transduction histidine kinase/CheY-like chemotaxis protein